MKRKESISYFWFALLTLLMILVSCEEKESVVKEYCECERTNRSVYLNTKFKRELYDSPYQVECQDEVTEWTTYEFVYDRDTDQSEEKQFIITCKN